MKLHVLVTTEDFITNFVVTISNIDDRDALFELSSSLSNTSIIGDKCYIGNDLAVAIAKEQSNVLFA
nr:transposase [Clostridium collagenovorans]